MLFGFMLIGDEMKFTAPRIDGDTSAKCKEKITRNVRLYTQDR